MVVGVFCAAAKSTFKMKSGMLAVPRFQDLPQMNLSYLPAFAACVLMGIQLSAAEPAASLVVLNGKVLTVDQKASVAEAVAIRDGRFVYVGTAEAARKLVGPATRVLDAG